jgi:hypothetical protein
MKLLVRGIACCVLASGAVAQVYGGGSNVVVIYPPQQVQPPPPPPVAVVVPPEQQSGSLAARQITYLIALKDGTVRQAEQYWVNGATLYYVAPDHQRKTVPVGSVDVALSERLNSEQNVAFALPPGQPGATLQSESVCRRTGSAARRASVARRASAARRAGAARKPSAVRRHCRCTYK